MFRPRLGPFIRIIDAILEADAAAPPKQRHTAQRIFERLKAEHGYGGGYSAVKELPSDAPFMKAYPAETTEAFLDGHMIAFAFFGGAPLSILYDNTKLAVAKIVPRLSLKRTGS